MLGDVFFKIIGIPNRLRHILLFVGGFESNFDIPHFKVILAEKALRFDCNDYITGNYSCRGLIALTINSNSEINVWDFSKVDFLSFR